jgi:hypothetical protein
MVPQSYTKRSPTQINYILSRCAVAEKYSGDDLGFTLAHSIMYFCCSTRDVSNTYPKPKHHSALSKGNMGTWQVCFKPPGRFRLGKLILFGREWNQ